MLVPFRTGNSPAYRYGFQGQEKDDEIKGGDGNSLNYTFRMHDPRVARFFATDPLEKKYPFFSPYQFSANTPIMAVELEGLESSNDPNMTQNGDVSFKSGLDESNNMESFAQKNMSSDNGDPNKCKCSPIKSTAFGKFFKELRKFSESLTVTYSNTTGPHGGSGGSTSIFSIYGNNTYTNSTPNGSPGGIAGFFGNMTEPNNSIHIQSRIKGSNNQIGLIYFKNKLKDKDGVGFQHPSSFHFTFSFDKLNEFNIGGLGFSTNLSLGLGSEIGIPRSPSSPANQGKNKIIGMGASAIYRLDANIINGFFINTAVTFHHMQTFNESRTNYTGQGNGSVGVSVGIGKNFGGR